MFKGSYILMDIEGTTTSVAFVYDTLFPYFKTRIHGFLQDRASLLSVAEPLRLVQNTLWEEAGVVLTLEELADQLVAWTTADRKHPALKAIQGVAWRDGYEKGALKGHVYEDVPPALTRWKALGMQLGIYSSGSAEAQHLLFKHAIFGDLTPCFSNYFDTGVGPKRDVGSYQNIAEFLQLLPNTILFLSDVAEELDAAATAGMHTTQVVRPGTAESSRHPVVKDFSAIILPS
ncbi:MAG: acireductone synthase [Saprospiraceae bacterium]|nr:acireductone synthase [Saprospiraceae bacterium]